MALVLSVAAPLASAPAAADVASLTVETGCSDVSSYNGELSPAAGAYDLYVRLGRTGDRAQVTGYTQILGNQGVCAPYTPVAATGDSWTKLGTFTSDGSDTYVFQLTSPSLAALPSANRPTVMLVPHNNPVCVPTTECAVTVGGMSGYIRPPGTLLSQNSLHVLQVTNPASDQVQRVDYYVDDTLAYTTKTLRPFNLRYVPGAGHSATIILQYASGQKVILPQKLPGTDAYYYGNVFNVLFRMYVSASPVLVALLCVLAALLVLWAILWTVDRFRRHRLWQESHGFSAYKEQHLTTAQRRFVDARERVMEIAVPATKITTLLIVVVGSILALNTYGPTIFNIDGQSMQDTYMSGRNVLVDRTPVTWAHLNGREYVPKRGDVVIVKAIFGDASQQTADTVNLLLIKRVIGLPGDHVTIQNGHVTIYNKANPAGFDPDGGAPWAKTMHHNLPTESLDIQLSQSQIFVSGDNRPESIDSRFSGPLQASDVVGRVVPGGCRSLVCL